VPDRHPEQQPEVEQSFSRSGATGVTDLVTQVNGFKVVVVEVNGLKVVVVDNGVKVVVVV
jgi:hypothetical protein